MVHCTLHVSEQFGAMYMHNHDDKYPARLGFEPDTSRLQSPVDMNEPSEPACRVDMAGKAVSVGCEWQYTSSPG